jgi:glycosyltransferase involved in cell wall biosynthesis
MENRISIVIPNYNGAETIGKCLEAVFSSRYENFETIVVDDNSRDNSVDIIKKHPCRLIRFENHAGTSRARNAGGFDSTGDFIFFTDSDCIIEDDTLSKINAMISSAGDMTVIGGTYSRLPYDQGFFNTFQSVFVNYSETKKADNPDYIAAHTMIINTRTFRESRGFPEKFLPIIEDVEFSHRLRRQGLRLLVNPEIQVRHIFNFSILRSLRNAFRKSRYWTMYSLKNKDAFVDSGSASVELKTNVLSCFTSILLIALWAVSGQNLFFLPLLFVFSLSCFISRRLLRDFFETKGLLFLISATLYYSTLYALAVGTGAITGTAEYFLRKRKTF